MFINPSLTLFISVLALTVSSVEAHDFDQLNRRHDSLKRMIRKRQAEPSIFTPIENVVGNPTTNTVSAGAVPAPASASASASASADPSAIASVSATSSASAADASLSASASASVSVSVSSASVLASSASVAPAPSSIPPTSQAPQPTATPEADDINTSAVSHSTSTVTQTASVSADPAAPTSFTSQNLSATSKKTTITTVLIVVAASVAGIAILWTIFRKWKLGHSAKFNERMAPIDWQPTNEESIVPAHRLGRTPSNSSSNHHGLEHDFTAPAARLAPVGGYADLARGPSPQPQMQETLVRGPSNRSYGATRPAYDTGVPLHHQAGYGNGDADAYDYNGDAVRF